MSNIKLDQNWSINGSKHNWTLQFEEERDREEPAKDGSTTWMFEDRWYFPNIKQALNKYVSEAVKVSEDSKNILEKLNSIETTIKNLKV